MHFIWLWEGQSFADESADSLAESVVPTLNVASLSGLFSNRLVLARVDHRGVCFPKVAEWSAPAIFFGNQFPELSAGFRGAVADEKWDDLAGSATQGYPNPSFAGLWIHKRPQFVQFEHVKSSLPEEASSRCRETIWRFFNPVEGSLMADAETLRQTPRRGAFLGKPNNSFLKLLAFAHSLKNPAKTAGLAFVFRIAWTVWTVFDNLFRTTFVATFYIKKPYWKNLMQKYQTTQILTLPYINVAACPGSIHKPTCPQLHSTMWYWWQKPLRQFERITALGKLLSSPSRGRK